MYFHQVITLCCMTPLGFAQQSELAGSSLKPNLHRCDTDNGDIWCGWGGLTPRADCCLAGVRFVILSTASASSTQLHSWLDLAFNSCRWIQAEAASEITATDALMNAVLLLRHLSVAPAEYCLGHQPDSDAVDTVTQLCCFFTF